MKRPLLSVDALEVGYAGKALLKAVSLEVLPGQFWCVLGRNGAGKTTLVRTLLGLLPPISGGYTRAERLRLGYLPQRARFDELYPMSARDVVLMGTDRDLSFLRPRPREATECADSMLKALDLESLGAIRFRELSEGQKQRVLLARLSAGRPTLAVLDEPTTAMDRPAEEQAFRHLREQCAKHGSCLMVVTHDFALARAFANYALFVDDASRCVVLGTIDEVFASDVLRRRYDLPTNGTGA